MQKITVKRYEPALDGELLWSCYASSDYRDFFRRVPADYKKADLMNIEAMTQSVFYTVWSGSRCLGFGEICKIDPYGQTAQIGFLLRKEYQDQSPDGLNEKYAFTAFRSFVHYIFNITQLNKLSARILSHRTDLRKSLIRGGFYIEGGFRDSIFFCGRYHSELELAMFREDFERYYSPQLFKNDSDWKGETIKCPS